MGPDEVPSPPVIGTIDSDQPDEPPLLLNAYLARGLTIVRPPRERLIYASDGFALAGWLAVVIRQSRVESSGESRHRRDFNLRFSPDGRYYSYTSTESGQTEVYVSALAGGARTAVSHGGAALARWSRDGKELFYLTFDRRLVSVPVRANPTLELGTPVTLFAVGSKGWVDFDVAPDGNRFLAIIPEIISTEQPLIALINR